MKRYTQVLPYPEPIFVTLNPIESIAVAYPTHVWTPPPIMVGVDQEFWIEIVIYDHVPHPPPPPPGHIRSEITWKADVIDPDGIIELSDSGEFVLGWWDRRFRITYEDVRLTKVGRYKLKVWALVKRVGIFGDIEGERTVDIAEVKETFVPPPTPPAPPPPAPLPEQIVRILSLILAIMTMGMMFWMITKILPRR